MLPYDMFELRAYIDDKGRRRFERWFETLGAVAAARVTIALTRMEQGNFSNAKAVGGKLETSQTRRRAGPTTNAGGNMPLTHNFKDTIRARAQREPKFRQALLREAVECYLAGDLNTGKAVLRDYVNATLGFAALEDQTDIPAKSLMRMLGPKGSPSAANLASILTALQKAEGVYFELSLRR